MPPPDTTLHDKALTILNGMMRCDAIAMPYKTEPYVTVPSLNGACHRRAFTVHSATFRHEALPKRDYTGPDGAIAEQNQTLHDHTVPCFAEA